MCMLYTDEQARGKLPIFPRTAGKTELHTSFRKTELQRVCLHVQGLYLQNLSISMPDSKTPMPEGGRWGDRGRQYLADASLSSVSSDRSPVVGELPQQGLRTEEQAELLRAALHLAALSSNPGAAAVDDVAEPSNHAHSAPRACTVLMPKMGPAAIGRRLEVWWDTDGAWYSAQVRRYDAKSGQHFLEYDDGDTEWADLAHEESQGGLSWSIRPCDVPSRGAAQSRASCSSAGKQASDQRTSKGALQCASPISMPCAKCKLSRKGITHCLERGHDKSPAVVKDEDDRPHLMQCSQCKVARKGMQHCIERGHVLQLKATVDVDHDETAPMLVRCALCKRSRKGVKHCIRKGHVLQSEAEVEGENDETPCLMQCSQCKGSRKGIKYCIERGHTVQTESVDV